MSLLKFVSILFLFCLVNKHKNRAIFLSSLAEYLIQTTVKFEKEILDVVV